MIDYSIAGASTAARASQVGEVGRNGILVPL